jgi:hypothetical protein
LEDKQANTHTHTHTHTKRADGRHRIIHFGPHDSIDRDSARLDGDDDLGDDLGDDLDDDDPVVGITDCQRPPPPPPNARTQRTGKVVVVCALGSWERDLGTGAAADLRPRARTPTIATFPPVVALWQRPSREHTTTPGRLRDSDGTNKVAAQRRTRIQPAPRDTGGAAKKGREADCLALDHRTHGHCRHIPHTRCPRHSCLSRRRRPATHGIDVHEYTTHAHINTHRAAMALPVGNGGGVEPLTDDEMVKGEPSSFFPLEHGSRWCFFGCDESECERVRLALVGWL